MNRRFNRVFRPRCFATSRLEQLREQLGLESRQGVPLGGSAASASSSASPPSSVVAIATPLQPLPPWHEGAVTPTAVRALYRQLWRKASSMPTINRRNYIRRKVADEFRDAIDVVDTERVDFLFRLGETQLETIHVQAEHLSDMGVDPY